MKEIIDNLLNSFSDNKVGYSSKRLTAFMLTVCIVAIHAKWILLGDFSQIEMVLTIDYSMIATLFGLTTYQKIKENTTTKVETVEQEVTDNKSKTTITNEQVG